MKKFCTVTVLFFILILAFVGCDTPVESPSPGTPAQQVVTFMVDGQVFATAEFGTEEIKLLKPEKSGYFFDGWYVPAGLAGSSLDEEFDPEQSEYTETVYARLLPAFVVENGVVKGLTDVAKQKEITDVVIPAELYGETVTEIGESAFKGNQFIESVTVKGVPKIGRQAFSRCKVLETLVLENGVEVIENSAFASCSRITSVEMPDSVTTLEKYCFNLCSAIETLTIGNGVRTIGTEAFRGCPVLTEVTIGASLESVGKSMLMGANKLQRLTIPFVGERRDGTGAPHLGFIFGVDHYTGQSGYDVPASLQEINLTGDGNVPDFAFYDCRNIQKVTLANGVKEIGNASFSGCAGLTEIALPDTVEVLGYSAFAKCTGVVEFVAPELLTEVGPFAFYSCEKLERAVFSNGLTGIGRNAFKACDALAEVSFAQPDGWVAEEDALGAESVGDVSTAAVMLKQTYLKKAWIRG